MWGCGPFFAPAVCIELEREEKDLMSEQSLIDVMGSGRTLKGALAKAAEQGAETRSCERLQLHGYIRNKKTCRLLDAFYVGSCGRM